MKLNIFRKFTPKSNMRSSTAAAKSSTPPRPRSLKSQKGGPSPRSNSTSTRPPLSPPLKTSLQEEAPSLEIASSCETDASISSEPSATSSLTASNSSVPALKSRPKTNHSAKMNRSRRGDESMASADKEMEERAKRAKELLSMRYKGLKNEQVSEP